MAKGHTTLSAVAKILGAEGFSEFCSNEVKRYWFARCARPQTLEKRSRLEKIQRAFGQMCREKLNERDQLVLGKYISVLLAAHFDTGLRLGLMTLAADFQQEQDDEPVADLGELLAENARLEKALESAEKDKDMLRHLLQQEQAKP